MIVGILLAGGQSARMGRDKAALVVDDAGTTLGARAIAALRAVCWRVVCVGHGRGVPDDVPRVDDPLDGPLVALVHACASPLVGEEANVFVVLPVDMPSVDPRMLTQLLEARAKNDARASCFALAANANANANSNASSKPSSNALHDRAEPLPLVLSREGLRSLQDAVAHGERRFGEAVRALRPALVRVGKIPENLNEPAEFEAWSKAKSGR